MTIGTAYLEALPVAVYITDRDGRITFYNDAAAELWGRRPELTEKWSGAWRLYWPDGTPLSHEQCPMALTLKEGRPVRGKEAIAERPDGTRITYVPYPTPLRDASGELIGAINLLMDVTQSRHSEIESQRLAAIVQSSDDAIVGKTLEGRITSWNPGASRIFGYASEEMIGQSITRIIPPELQDEERMILDRLGRGEHIQHYETERVTKEGRRINVSLTLSPLHDKTGRIVGASKVARDVTEQKRAEKLQRLLLDELNHRVKNILATVQAIANQSLIHAKDSASFAASFSGRIQALSAAHTQLFKEEFRGIDIAHLVREQVLIGVVKDQRISYSGPQVVVEGNAAIHLALVLHELATNARKYGALSVPIGRLAVTWEVRTNEGRELLMHWKETNGPKVSAPSTPGFGTSLIQDTMRSHGGETSIRYDAEGFSCEMRLPLHEEAALSHQISALREGDMDHSIPQTQKGNSKLAAKRILVIEDEPLVAMDLEASLTQVGCNVVGTAGTIDAAKKLIVNNDIDAALLDANLAGRPVGEVAAALTQKSIPFAFVTGHGRESLPEGFRDAVLLGKPFTPGQLYSVLEVLLYARSSVVSLRSRRS